MELSKLINKIEKIFPPSSALEGDKIGLQLQNDTGIVERILFCLEINDEVIDEAILNKIDCIITFHPLIFRPLQTIIDNERVGKLTKRLIKCDIAVIVIHTNFDVFENGTNKILANKIGLINQKIILPDKEYFNTGMGIVGDLEEDLEINDFLNLIANITFSNPKYSLGKKGIIKTVALICGSGSSFLSKVLSLKIDAFITADISYHTFHLVMDKILLVDPGHYEMEQFVPEYLLKILELEIQKDTEVLLLSKVRTNPVNTFINTNNTENLQINYLNKL